MKLIGYYTVGATLYAVLLDNNGQAWNGTAFEALNPANWTTYNIAMTEGAGGLYTGIVPALSADNYTYICYNQAGVNPAIMDDKVSFGAFSWDGTDEALLSNPVTVGTNNDKTGYKLASDGLDSVSIVAPTGVASNFREMVVATWRRFYKKATMTATDLKTYADDGATVVTSQPITDDNVTQSQGAAT